MNFVDDVALEELRQIAPRVWHFVLYEAEGQWVVPLDALINVKKHGEDLIIQVCRIQQAKMVEGIREAAMAHVPPGQSPPKPDAS